MEILIIAYYYSWIQFHFSSCTVFKFSYLKTALFQTLLCGIVLSDPSSHTEVSDLIIIALNIPIPTHSQVLVMPPLPSCLFTARCTPNLPEPMEFFDLLYSCSLGTAHCFSMTSLPGCLNLKCFSPFIHYRIPRLEIK